MTILPGLPKDCLQILVLPEHGDGPCSVEGLPGYTELILHSASEIYPLLLRIKTVSSVWASRPYMTHGDSLFCFIFLCLNTHTHTHTGTHTHTHATSIGCLWSLPLTHTFLPSSQNAPLSHLFARQVPHSLPPWLGFCFCHASELKCLSLCL